MILYILHYTPQSCHTDFSISIKLLFKKVEIYLKTFDLLTNHGCYGL